MVGPSYNPPLGATDRYPSHSQSSAQF